MRGPDQRAGEASTAYLRSPSAAARIAELNPGRADDRDPARAGLFPALVSHADGREPRGEGEGLPQGDRARAAQARECRGEGSSRRSCSTPSTSRYADQLRRLHASFPAEQVLVLVFTRTSAATMPRPFARCSASSRVDDTVPLQQVETEPLNTVRSVRMHELIRAVRRADFNPAQASGLSRALNALVPR